MRIIQLAAGEAIPAIGVILIFVWVEGILKSELL